jgi:hypothetical protein
MTLHQDHGRHLQLKTAYVILNVSYKSVGAMGICL